MNLEAKLDAWRRETEGLRPSPALLERLAPVGQGGARPRVLTARVAAVRPTQVARRRRQLRWAGVAAVAACLALLTAQAVQLRRDTLAKRAADAAGARRAQLEQQLETIRDLARAGRWGDAKVRLHDLQGGAPDFEPSSVSAYLDRADKEAPNEQLLNDAERSIRERRLRPAAEALARVRAASTMQRERLASLEDALRRLLDERQAELSALTAQPATRDSLVRLKDVAEDLLSQRPGDRVLQVLVETTARTIADLDAPAPPTAKGPRPELAVSQRYRMGDLPGALALADACAARHAACSKLQLQLAVVQRKLALAPHLEVEALEALYALDQEIAQGANTPNVEPVRRRLIALLTERAVRAKQRRSWAQASLAARRVVALDPVNPLALQIVRDAKDAANQLYLRGYQLRESDLDTARELMREAMECAPPDDAVHVKAKEWLQRLEAP